MTQHDKTLERIQRTPTPADVRWDEMAGLLQSLGFRPLNNDGSRRKFEHPDTGDSISLHQPHPAPEMKRYAVREVVAFLRQNGYLTD